MYKQKKVNIDNYWFLFDQNCEDYDKNNPFQINIATEKVDPKKCSHNIINNHYNSTLKYHYWLGIRSLEEPIIDN